MVNTFRKKKLKLSDYNLVFAMAATFVTCIALIGVDEYLDIPHRLLGAGANPFRMEEFLVECGTITLAALAVILPTAILIRKEKRLENFVRICAWCKKVSLDGRWVSLETYIKTKENADSTHGICEECSARLTKGDD